MRKTLLVAIFIVLGLERLVQLQTSNQTAFWLLTSTIVILWMIDVFKEYRK